MFCALFYSSPQSVVSALNSITCWGSMQKLYIWLLNFGHDIALETLTHAPLSVQDTFVYPSCEMLELMEWSAPFFLGIMLWQENSCYSISIIAFYCICAARHILVYFWSPCLSWYSVQDLSIVANSYQFFWLCSEPLILNFHCLFDKEFKN